MRNYKKGIIVLVPFPFTDLSSSKVRPAVVVSCVSSVSDVVVVFISSKKVKVLQKTDIRINNSCKTFSDTGLKIDSVVRVAKIATLDKGIILGELGRIDTNTEKELDKKIKMVFGL